jgi:hypothetical protein
VADEQDVPAFLQQRYERSGIETVAVSGGVLRLNLSGELWRHQAQHSGCSHQQPKLCAIESFTHPVPFSAWPA